MTGSRLHAAAGLALLLACWGCSGSDPTVPQAMFHGSGTGMRADGVRLTGSALDRDTVILRAVLGGPSSSTDLYSFAFDLVLSDPQAALYVPGSEVAGDVLQIDASQGVSVLVSQIGNRIVVGVTKLGGGGGNGVTENGEQVILSLELDVPAGGFTTVSLAGPPAALDSGGNAIASVSFDREAAVISR